MEELSSNIMKENPSDIKKELKLEKENLKLTLRKNKINEIIFSKRKITYRNNNIEDIKKKYSIKIEDIQIPNEFKLDIPNFINKVRHQFKYKLLFIHFILQFNISNLIDYLNSSDIKLNLYAIYIIKYFLEINKFNENSVNILYQQLNNEYLILLTNLLNKKNINLSYEVLIILINVSFSNEGELLFGLDEKIISNIATFMGNNREDITLLDLGILLIKNITCINSMAKQAFQNFNIIQFFNEIYEKYVLDIDFMKNLILCMDHFVNSRFGDNNILCVIKIIKSQLNFNLPIELLFRYVFILYNLSYYNNPKVYEAMIQNEIQKDFIKIYPFNEDNLNINKNLEEKKDDNSIEIIRENNKDINYNRELRIVILKIFGKIMSSANNNVIQSMLDSNISKFLTKVFQSTTDIKIIKIAFFCLSNICSGTSDQIKYLYNNETILEAFKAAQYVYDTLDSNNKFVDYAKTNYYMKAFRESNFFISLCIINSLYDKIMPYVRKQNYSILKILLKGLLVFNENCIYEGNKKLIIYILNAIYKLNEYEKDDDEEEIIMSYSIKFKEFLDKNAFKEILEKLQMNSDENIVTTAENLYDDIYDNGNIINEDINIDDIIEDFKNNNE